MTPTLRRLVSLLDVATQHPTCEGLRASAMAAIRAPGLALEFGVGDGHSIAQIAARFHGQVVYGFDSFFELPEPFVYVPSGHFSRGGVPPAVPGNVRLVTGRFEETLSSFFVERPGPVAFAHIDCDIYSSTQCVLGHLAGRLIPGSVLLFDEFWDFPGCEEHEARAFAEFLDETNLPVECIGRVDGDWCPVAFRVTLTSGAS